MGTYFSGCCYDVAETRAGRSHDEREGAQRIGVYLERLLCIQDSNSKTDPKLHQ